MEAPVEYIENFITDPDTVFEQLWNGLDWVKVTNRRIEYWTNTLNRPYTYGSGLGARTYQPQPANTVVDEIGSMLEAKLGFRYEGCFLNGYETERHGLNWHADDDPAIDHSCPIAVITVGGGRAIQFVEQPVAGEKVDKAKIQEVFLKPGSLLLMDAGMQQTHFHQIPKAGFKVSKPRISLTYRKLFP